MTSLDATSELIMVDDTNSIGEMPTKRDFEKELSAVLGKMAAHGLSQEKANSSQIIPTPTRGRPPVPVTNPNWKPLVDAAGSVKELSRRLNVTNSTVSRWVNGDRTPGPEHLEKITRMVKLLGVMHPIEWLR